MSDLANHHQAAPSVDPHAQAVRAVFLFLHGAYGSAFLSKWATGEKDSQGKDKGVRSAMMVWQLELSRFAPDVIETAVRRAAAASSQFPPNLPEIVSACEAAQPRRTYSEDHPALPSPAPDMDRLMTELEPLRVAVGGGDPRAWAHKLRARHDAGARLSAYQIACYREALGIHAGA